MARIPQKELLDAMTDLSMGAYKLLMYYYSKGDGFKFYDSKIGQTIGTSDRQVKKFRNELIDTKYLTIQRGDVDVYFVGKIAVENFRNGVVEDEDPEQAKKAIIAGVTRKSKKSKIEIPELMIDQELEPDSLFEEVEAKLEEY